MSQTVRLNSNPIKIEIKDPKRFGDVAFLVDQPEFLEDIARLRQQWQIEKPFTRNKKKDWCRFPWTNEENEVKDKELLSFMASLMIVKDTPEDDIEHKLYVFKKYAHYRDKLPNTFFHYDLFLIRHKYKKALNYAPVIAAALLYNQIVEEDYQTCFIANFFRGNANYQIFHEPVPTIMFFPNVTSEEVIKTYRDFGGFALDDYRKKYLKIKSNLNRDTVENVKRDRDWYWLKQQGLSYAQILNKTKEQKMFISRDGLIKAINRYKNQLQLDSY